VVLETIAVYWPLSQSINWTENRPSGHYSVLAVFSACAEPTRLYLRV
jgi:hypothetical protein